MIYYIILIFVLSSLDLYSKSWAKKNLEDGRNRYILNDSIELRYAENRGIAFNRLYNRKKLIIFMGVILLALLTYLFFIEKSYRLYLSLIFSGGFGNTFDRVRRGYVVDFIRPNLKMSPIFNLADFYIFAGIILSMLEG